MKYYHGTLPKYANNIEQKHDLSKCNSIGEVGRGFYVSDFLPYSFCVAASKIQIKKGNMFTILEYSFDIKQISSKLQVGYLQGARIKNGKYVPIIVSPFYNGSNNRFPLEGEENNYSLKTCDVLYNRIADRMAFGAYQLIFKTIDAEIYLNKL